MFGRCSKWSIPRFMCGTCSLCLSRKIALSICKITHHIIIVTLTTVAIKCYILLLTYISNFYVREQHIAFFFAGYTLDSLFVITAILAQEDRAGAFNSVLTWEKMETGFVALIR